MSSYFSNIIASSSQTTASETKRIRPFVRSHSPIAALDQRLAIADEDWSLEGQDEGTMYPNFYDSELSHSEQKNIPSNEAPNAPRRIPSESGVHHQIPEGPPPTKSDQSPPNCPASPGPLSLSTSVSANRPSPENDPQHLKLNPQVFDQEKAAVVSTEQISATSPQAASSRIETKSQLANPSPISAKNSEPAVQVEFDETRSPTETRRSLSEKRGAKRDPRDSAQENLSVRQPLVPPRSHAPSGPRIVIDRINVEVVPPPFSPPKGAKESNKRIDKAKPPISQIGALSKVSNKQSLSFRYR